jgi:hypothetical protein
VSSAPQVFQFQITGVGFPVCICDSDGAAGRAVFMILAFIDLFELILRDRQIYDGNPVVFPYRGIRCFFTAAGILALVVFMCGNMLLLFA